MSVKLEMKNLVGHAVLAKNVSGLSRDQVFEIHIGAMSRSGLAKVSFEGSGNPMTWIDPKNYEVVEDLGFTENAIEIIDSMKKQAAGILLFQKLLGVHVIEDPFELKLILEKTTESIVNIFSDSSVPAEKVDRFIKDLRDLTEKVSGSK